MKYMGSKSRIAKHILPIILENRTEGQYYVDPFVGGGNMIDKVTGNRIGSDFNPFVIKALELIRDDPHSLPDKISENECQELKTKLELNGLTGVVGFGCSFGSKWFGGYARGCVRNYILETKKNAIKQSEKLKGIKFIHSSYDSLIFPDNSIIYCDKPYEGTTKYKDAFKHNIFWTWARMMNEMGHTVFVSEYDAPADFKEVWSGEIKTSFSTSKSLNAIEKLFTL